MNSKHTDAFRPLARAMVIQHPMAAASTVALVKRAAADIEPDGGRVLEWYQSTPICELSDLTGQELVAMGRADLLVAFLRSIKRGDRG